MLRASALCSEIATEMRGDDRFLSCSVDDHKLVRVRVTERVALPDIRNGVRIVQEVEAQDEIS